MEFRCQNDDEIGTNTAVAPSSSLAHSHSTTIRSSALSKPTLNPAFSLVPSRSAGQSATNGGIFAANTSPQQTIADHHCLSSRPLVLSPAQASNTSPNSATNAMTAAINGLKVSPLSSNSTSIDPPCRYKECLRNHAANIGVHVVDGCGEFMPYGHQSTPESMKCAACGCHRSFHRKEITGDTIAGIPNYRHSVSGGTRSLPRPKTALQGSSGVLSFGVNASGGTTTESSSEDRIDTGTRTPFAAPRKRFRTKFTSDQKDKMQRFAESIGWSIQKQDEAMIEQFCAENGVRRKVLKVWMHNNKHIVKRQHENCVDQMNDQQQMQMN